MLTSSTSLSISELFQTGTCRGVVDVVTTTRKLSFAAVFLHFSCDFFFFGLWTYQVL